MRRTLLFLASAVALVVAALAAAGLAYVPDTAIPHGLAGRHVTVGGRAVRVVQEGQGPDVLLIHGSPGSIEDWAPVVPLLRGEARLTAFDRPGSGFSGATGEYSLEHNADVALGVLDALGLEDVTVVGHSYGGSTALAMALRAPAKVRSYVVLDSATYVPSREVTPMLRLLAIPAVGVGFARVAARPLAGARIEGGIRENLRRYQPTPDFLALRTAIWSTPKVMVSIAGETIGSRAFLAAQSPRYPSIDAPVRIVAQADDPFRRGAAERLHADVSNSSLTLLPGVGHYVQFDDPEAVAREVRAALASR